MRQFVFTPNKLKLNRGEFRKKVDAICERCDNSYLRMFLSRYRHIVCTLDKTLDLHFEANSEISTFDFDHQFGYIYENNYLFSEISKQIEPAKRLPKLTMELIFELRRETSETISLFAKPETIYAIQNEIAFTNVFQQCNFPAGQHTAIPDFQSKMYDSVFNLFKSHHVQDEDLAIVFLGRDTGQYQIRTIVKHTKTEFRVDKGMTIDLDSDRIVKISRPISDTSNIVKLTK